MNAPGGWDEHRDPDDPGEPDEPLHTPQRLERIRELLDAIRPAMASGPEEDEGAEGEVSSPPPSNGGCWDLLGHAMVGAALVIVLVVLVVLALFVFDVYPAPNP